MIFVKLRKKLWLPIKFKRFHRKKTESILGKTKEEIYAKIQETEQLILEKKRKNKANEAYFCEGYLEALNWFAYESEKDTNSQ